MASDKSMSWRSAIEKVLGNSLEPMNCSEIALEVEKKGFRRAFGLNATPANSISTTINVSMANEGEESPFVRVARGLYTLRRHSTHNQDHDEVDTAVSPASGIINALGMFWKRSKVSWKTEPRLLEHFRVTSPLPSTKASMGRTQGWMPHPRWSRIEAAKSENALGKQQLGAKTVDFCKQIGVYLLHDTQGVVYVGRAIDQSIGKRLQQHTTDRLSGRWDRFSWFGMYPVEENGSLQVTADISGVGVNIVIATLEAVLIEGLEPRQNRRRGDDFQAVEFLQTEDPEIEQARRSAYLKEFTAQISALGGIQS